MVDFASKMRPKRILHLDYETKSRAPLKDVGAHRYAEDESCEILLCAASWDDQDEVFLWVNPKYGTAEMTGCDNAKVTQMVAEADIIYAHNAPFEAAITWAKGACYGFNIPIEKWRCTMAMARTAGLPPSLEMVGEVLGLTDQKDRRGKALIKLFCEPQKDGEFVNPRDRPDDWFDFGEYCKQDVRTEKAVHRALKPFELKGEVLKTFLFDLRMNQRGIPVNVAALRNALAIINEVQGTTEIQFRRLTGLNPTQREEVRKLVNLPDMQRETVEAALLETPTSFGMEQRQRVLKLYQNLSYAAVAKVETMLGCVCRDGRVRGCHTFYGTGPGRWCLTGDHEILTPEGWMRLDEWVGGEIACWSQDETVSFQKAKSLSFSYAGNLIWNKSKRIDQLATPDHRMPGWALKTNNFEVRKVSQLASGFQIPYTGTREKPSKVNSDELRLLVATQADGHYVRDGSIRFHFKKVRKIERLTELLFRLELPSTRQKNGDGSTTITIVARHVPLLLHLFRGKTFGSWILDMDAGVFFEELALWDGSMMAPNSIQYSTCNKVNADWVQSLAHTSGFAASITTKKNRNPRWRQCYYVTVWTNPSNRSQLPDRGTKVKFKGRVYCAKTPTGFFLVRRHGTVWVTGNSARLIQPQNFKRTPKWMRPIMHEVYRRICEGWGARELSLVYGEPLELISGIIRHFIGGERELLDGDFSGIQAKVILWLAGELELLEMMKRGEDMYKKTAAPIYEIPQSEVDSDQREVGKRVFLGCQFQMGADTFKRTLLEQYQMDVPLAICKKGVKVYRAMCPKVVKFWDELQSDALAAVTNPGQPFGRFLVQTVAKIPFLLMKLPSGRFIAYPHPQSAPETYKYMTESGEERTGKRIGITYWGQLPLSTQWGRIKLYGGKLAENLTMGVEADIASHGLRAAERAGYLIFMTVHDQGLAEMPIFGPLFDELSNEVERTPESIMEDFARVMGSSPNWAAGLPIKIDPKITPYFSK
jgi:DNA polymerase family A